MLDIFLLGLHGYRRNDTRIKQVFEQCWISSQVKLQLNCTAKHTIDIFTEVKKAIQSTAAVPNNMKMSGATN